jgi:hypothetical protein
MSEKAKCPECDNGRYFDPSHGCSRRCLLCKGTGKIDAINTTPGPAERLAQACRVAVDAVRAAGYEDISSTQIGIAIEAVLRATPVPVAAPAPAPETDSDVEQSWVNEVIPLPSPATPESEDA